ncbi:MAG: V-type ATP synthase subunit F [Clostridiales bacterium]|nr:V-type ATP synthase subunit F [Clostridiales bacterium]
MKFYLISDNVDTLMGMRLAGIDGVVVSDARKAEEVLRQAMEREDVGIILITEHLSRRCEALVYELKRLHSRPLLVEIPDRHGSGRGRDSITRYVQEAIGVKL